MAADSGRLREVCDPAHTGSGRRTSDTSYRVAKGASGRSLARPPSPQVLQRHPGDGGADDQQGRRGRDGAQRLAGADQQRGPPDGQQGQDDRQDAGDDRRGQKELGIQLHPAAAALEHHHADGVGQQVELQLEHYNRVIRVM